MKKIIVIAMMLVFTLACTLSAEEDVKHQPKKMKTTFTIVFNEITIQEAADLERRINKEFKDACSVEVDMEPVSVSEYINPTVMYDGVIVR